MIIYQAVKYIIPSFLRPFGVGSLAQKLSSFLNVSCVFWTGRWGIPFGCVARKVPMLCVVGEAMDIEKNENPSQEELDRVHFEFGERMKQLFLDHRRDYVEMVGADESWLQKELKFEDE
jgi:hypothetical protein